MGVERDGIGMDKHRDDLHLQSRDNDGRVRERPDMAVEPERKARSEVEGERRPGTTNGRVGGAEEDKEVVSQTAPVYHAEAIPSP